MKTVHPQLRQRLLLGGMLCAVICAPLPAQSNEQSNSPHIRRILGAQYKVSLRENHSRLIVGEKKISRLAITAPSIVNFVQYSPREVSLIGLKSGSTDLTMWFEGDPQPAIYEITVLPSRTRQDPNRMNMAELQQKLMLLFPNCHIRLIPVGHQLVVKGQVRSRDQADRILRLVRAEASMSSENGRDRVVSMINVPGEHQVMLRVRIAELNRSQLRRLGVTARDLLKRGKSAGSAAAASANVSGVFDSRDVNRMMRWLKTRGTISYLAEPSLTVMSGKVAHFLSGGEFAVPATGRDGAADTKFRGYGTSLKVTPTVLDRDLIRLEIMPEFSQIDEATTVNGIPGTSVRRVQTVVELREGQTIAIGGLISRRTESVASRSPFRKFRRSGRAAATEAETELLIIVTPEIVRPIDNDEVPPMPNHYLTHPSDCELFHQGRTEGPADTGVYRVNPFGTGHSAGRDIGFSLIGQPSGGVPVSTQAAPHQQPLQISPDSPAAIPPVQEPPSTPVATVTPMSHVPSRLPNAKSTPDGSISGAPLFALPGNAGSTAIRSTNRSETGFEAPASSAKRPAHVFPGNGGHSIATEDVDASGRRRVSVVPERSGSVLHKSGRTDGSPAPKVTPRKRPAIRISEPRSRPAESNAGKRSTPEQSRRKPAKSPQASDSTKARASRVKREHRIRREVPPGDFFPGGGHSLPARVR